MLNIVLIKTYINLKQYIKIPTFFVLKVDNIEQESATCASMYVQNMGAENLEQSMETIAM